MCGIAGIYKSVGGFVELGEIRPMTNALIHRGPDGEGQWVSEDGKVGLGHRRLSIIDLSENGAQPMHYENNLVITYNGEIYNYLELKKSLIDKGFVFKTDSDTEVLLAAYSFWGTSCLSHLDGMFSFAIYDKVSKELFCARDRFGEKPFYYANYLGCFYFASEMKALWAAGVPKSMKNTMIYQFLANDLVENPNNQTETFYENIYKLKNSSYFIYKGDVVKQISYWKIEIEDKSDLSFELAAKRFKELFEISIARRLRSDVAIGTSLSGGLDSSSVVSEVSHTMRNNHTFSARFSGFARDEGKYIDIVRNVYGTNHHNVFLEAEMLNKYLDKLIFHQEEPFQTGSIFAQFKVYEAARNANIVVMLDGQGADEYLCGYDKDFSLFTMQFFPNIFKLISYKNSIQKNHNIKITAPKSALLLKLAPDVFRIYRHFRDKLGTKAPIGISREFHDCYRPELTPFHQFGSIKETLRHEMTNQGLEKLLRFADRNSMAHSVEVRLPFLFHELVQFVFSLPESYLMHQGWSKSILRKAMEKDLPHEIAYRKDKIGFEAPTNIWQSNPELSDVVRNAQTSLIRNGIITNSYTNLWKIMILGKFL